MWGDRCRQARAPVAVALGPADTVAVAHSLLPGHAGGRERAATATAAILSDAAWASRPKCFTSWRGTRTPAGGTRSPGIQDSTAEKKQYSVIKDLAGRAPHGETTRNEATQGGVNSRGK